MKRLLWKEAREQWPFALAVLATPFLLLWYSRIVRHHGTRLDGHEDLIVLFLAIAVYGATRMPHERTRGRMTLAQLPVPARAMWAVKVLPGLLVSLLAVGLAGLLSERVARIPAMANPWTELPHVVMRSYAVAALSYAGAFTLSLAFGVPPSALIGTAAGLLAPGAIATILISFGVGTGNRGFVRTAETGFTAYAWLAAAVLLLAAYLLIRSRREVSDPRCTRWSVAVLTGLVVLAPWSVFLAMNTRNRLGSDNGPDNAITPPLVSHPYGRVAYAEERFEPDRAGPTRVFIYHTALWTRRIDGSGPELVERLESTRTGANQGVHYPDVAPVGWVSGGRLLYAARQAGARQTQWKLWTPGRGPAIPLTAFVTAASQTGGYAPEMTAVEPDGERVAVLRPSVGAILGGGSTDLWRFDIPARRWTLLVPGPAADGVRWRAGRIYLYDDGAVQSIAPEGGALRDEEKMPEETAQ